MYMRHYSVTRFNLNFFKKFERIHEYDNFDLIRYREENESNDGIFKDILAFCISTDFCQKTGLTALDLMKFDPSTFTMIKQLYDTLKEPEIEKQKEMIAETEKLKNAAMIYQQK